MKTEHRETTIRLYCFALSFLAGCATAHNLSRCPGGSHLSIWCNANPFSPPSQDPMYHSSASLQTMPLKLPLWITLRFKTHFRLVLCLLDTPLNTHASLQIRRGFCWKPFPLSLSDHYSQLWSPSLGQRHPMCVLTGDLSPYSSSWVFVPLFRFHGS